MNADKRFHEVIVAFLARRDIAALVIAPAALVGGCAHPTVIVASPDQIALSAMATPKQQAIAGEMAVSHCASLGKRAVLDSVSAAGTTGSIVPTATGPVGAINSTSVLKFDCR